MEASASELQVRTLSFVTPSGESYTIREQNGEDDDIISNPVAARELTNLAAFISNIVLSSSRKDKQFTIDEVMELPRLDKYLILFKSRIFSLGSIVEFEHIWQNAGAKTKIEYEQDLSEYVFNDYSKSPDNEEFSAKPYAIPYYTTNGKETDLEITTTSGKVLRFDLLTGLGEKYLLNLAPEKNTKNQNLVARNLRLLVGGNFEPVTNFRLFSPKDMVEIRKEVSSNDPDFEGTLEIVNPNTNEITLGNIIALPGFFYPGEI